MERHDSESMRTLRATVESLYTALQQGQGSRVAKLMASDVEWWFHGPHQCQHMMRLLTGESPSQVGFKFQPKNLEEVRGHECVIAEGWEGSQVYWVHVWKLKDGVVTELREYFNTWLTVTDCSGGGGGGAAGWDVRLCTVWESVPRDQAHASLPGLLLAI